MHISRTQPHCIVHLYDWLTLPPTIYPSPDLEI